MPFMDETTVRHPEIPWRDIIDTRNRIAHGYFDLNLKNHMGYSSRRPAGAIAAPCRFVRICPEFSSPCWPRLATGSAISRWRFMKKKPR